MERFYLGDKQITFEEMKVLAKKYINTFMAMDLFLAGAIVQTPEGELKIVKI